jgi:hypothetical protein
MYDCIYRIECSVKGQAEAGGGDEDRVAEPENVI